MKKIFILLALLFPAVAMNAQDAATDDSQDATEQVLAYAEIIGIDKNVDKVDNNLSVQIEFGDKKNPWGEQGRVDIVNEKGKKVKFKSMVDALNYLARKGWQLESTYVIPGTERNTFHWVVSKPVDPNAPAPEKKKKKLLPW